MPLYFLIRRERPKADRKSFSTASSMSYERCATQSTMRRERDAPLWPDRLVGEGGDYASNKGRSFALTFVLARSQRFRAASALDNLSLLAMTPNVASSSLSL